MKRSPRFYPVGSAVLMGALAVGFLGWISPWLNFGMGRMKMDVTISPGEVQGLKRLGELAAPDERFATNKHAVDTLRSLPDRSSLRHAVRAPVLIEGYEYKSVTALRGLRPCFARTTSSSAPPTRRRYTISPRHGTFVGLSPVLAPTFPCPAHCLHGWSRSRTAATLRFIESINPPHFHEPKRHHRDVSLRARPETVTLSRDQGAVGRALLLSARLHRSPLHTHHGRGTSVRFGT